MTRKGLRARRGLLGGLTGMGLICMLAPAPSAPGIAAASGLRAALAAPTERASPAPPRAQVVRIPFPRDDGTLTPYTFSIGYPLVTLVYDTLLWRDRDGVPQPWLATSAAVDPAGTALTLSLAPGVRWQDGEALTSADVAFTLAYVAGHPHPRFTQELEQLAGVETPDASTVVIHLRRPSPGFRDQPLADLPILPQHLWASLPAGQAAPEGLPVGSGPYRLVAHRPGEGYRFEANPDYFRGPPAAASLEVPIVSEAADLPRALTARDADMIPVSPTVSRRARPRGLGISLLEGPAYDGTVLALNVRRAPFDRPEVRRAVSMALDLPRLARAVGDTVPADHGHIHPASPWASTQVLQRGDEERARRELSSLGLAPLQVLVRADDAVQLAAARQVALALSRVGPPAEPRAVPREDVDSALGAGGGSPSFQLAIATSPASASEDPDGLRRLFGPGSVGAGLNPSGYASPAFDAAADRETTAVDPSARQAATQEMLFRLAEDAPTIPLLFANAVYAYRPAVFDGWVVVRGEGILDKLSFVDPERGRAPGAAPSSRPGTSSPAITIGWLAIVLLAAAGAVAAREVWGWFRR